VVCVSDRPSVPTYLPPTQNTRGMSPKKVSPFVLKRPCSGDLFGGEVTNWLRTSWETSTAIRARDIAIQVLWERERGEIEEMPHPGRFYTREMRFRNWGLLGSPKQLDGAGATEMDISNSARGKGNCGGSITAEVPAMCSLLRTESRRVPCQSDPIRRLTDQWRGRRLVESWAAHKLWRRRASCPLKPTTSIQGPACNSIARPR